MYLQNTFNNIRFIFAAVLLSLAAVTAQGNEPDPTALIKKMSQDIAQLDRFTLQGDTSIDALLEEGQLIEHSSHVTMRVIRPYSVHIANHSIESTKNIYLTGHLFSVYDSATGFYAQKQIPAEEKNPLNYAVDKLGINAPLIDVLSDDFSTVLLDQATDIKYLGQSLIRGNRVHHLAIRSPELDVQIWIAMQSPHLPSKLVISSKWEGGAPRTVSFMEWELSPAISAKDLRFDVPKGAVKIDIQTGI